MKSNDIYPNFFIVGAPKTGTTSMADWLSQHPDFHVPEKKELNFFNTEHAHRDSWTTSDLNREFGANQAAFRVDASVMYCLSESALRNIAKLSDLCLVVLCLRDPKSMYFSIHAQQHKALFESEPDPAIAWQTHCEKVRLAERQGDYERAINLNYKEICASAEIFAKVQKHIPSDKLLVIDFDELSQFPSRVYGKIISRLNCRYVDVSLHHLNSRARLRFRWVHIMVRQLSILKQMMGISSSLGVARYISKHLTAPVIKKSNKELPPEAEHFFASQAFKLKRMFDDFDG